MYSSSLAFNESTDIHDVPQLVIYIHYVHPDVNVKEEMLDLETLIETTCGINIRNARDEEMNRFELPHNKLINVVTDSICNDGENLGLTGLLNKDPKIQHFLPLHCIIHLIVKNFKYKNVLKIVLHIVNLIKIYQNTPSIQKLFR